MVSLPFVYHIARDGKSRIGFVSVLLPSVIILSYVCKLPGSRVVEARMPDAHQTYAAGSIDNHHVSQTALRERRELQSFN